MTPEQVLQHYDNSLTFAAYNLGYSVAALQKWKKDKRIPIKAQILVEALTNGKLKADGKS